MRICLASLFSNSSRYLSIYMDQCKGFRDHQESLNNTVHFVWLEGNSKDKTYEKLKEYKKSYGFEAEILKHDCPRVYGSTEQPERMAQLGMLGNELIERALQYNPDVYLFIESDLRWEASTLSKMVEHVKNGADAVSPLCMVEGSNARGGSVHYDIWGVRGINHPTEMDGGKRFGPFTPYSPILENYQGGLVEVYSAGSAMAMNAKMLRDGLRYRSDLAFVGLCEEIRKRGHKVYIDASLRIWHPK